MNFLMVALGGALGASGRYAMGLIPFRGSFPLQTFIVNILGAILIGFITGIAAGSRGLPDSAVLFLKTGVCGGFTTFSTFSYEAVSLINRNEYFLGGIYIVLSVVGCIAGVIIGDRLAALVK